MGRHRTNPSRGFFMYNINENKSTCIICNMDMKGNHASNLERHLKRHHNDEFISLQEKKIKLSLKEEPNQSNQDYNIALQEDFEAEYLHVKLNQETVVKACIEMITLNGCSFELFECSGLRKLLNPILDALGNNFLISSENIKLMIPETVCQIIYKISKTLERRMISLTINKTTRLSRCILGISAQSVVDGHVNVYTLGMTELKDKPTGTDVKNVIEEVLAKYNIDLNQIYSITIREDEGMEEVVELLKSEIEERNYAIENGCQLQNFPGLQGVKCAAHMLQLAIEDSFKQPVVSVLITEARDLVKRLRTSSFLTKLKGFSMGKPILDCGSDWVSTYNMLKALLDCKACVSDYPECKWTKLQSIANALQPLTDAAFRLQNDQLTLSDFFGAWIESKIKLQNLENFFARILYDQMSNREDSLLENDTLLSAVYLDPRFQILLSSQQKLKAVGHLKRVWNKLEFLTKKADEEGERLPSRNEADVKPDEDVDDLEFFLRNKELAVKKLNSSLSADVDIECILNRFDNVKRLDRRKSVLEFWQENKNTFPYLYSVGVVVLGAPPTQFAVEKSFSGLKFLLRENRNGLSESLLEDILIIRGNFNLF